MCVCLKGQLGAKIRPAVLTSGGITVKMGGGGVGGPSELLLNHLNDLLWLITLQPQSN